MLASDWFDLSVEQHAAGFLEEAVASYREARLAGGPDAHTCFDLAGALEALGRHAPAIERYRQALEVDPHFGDGWNNLGNALARASAATTRPARRTIGALSINPDDLRAHYNLAQSLDEMGLGRESAPHWRAYLKHDAASPLAAHARNRLKVVI